MATATAVAVGTLPTSGTVDLTVSGFGTPTAAILFVSNANSTNNPQNDAVLNVGLWVSGAYSNVSAFSRNGVGTTDTARHFVRATANNYVVTILTNGGAVEIVYGVASTTDGIRISITSGSTTVARYVTAILIKGTSNAYIGLKDLGTSTSGQSITDPGFKPDFLAVLCNGGLSSTTGSTNCIWSFGVAHNNSSDVVSQGGIFLSSPNAAAATQSSTYIDDAYVGGQLHSDALTWKVKVNSFDTNGFTVQCNASAGSDGMSYLALKLADPDDAWVDVIDSATGTGNQAHTGTGFTPQVVAIAQTMATALQTVTQNGSIALGAGDGTRQRCVDFTDSDAADPTVATSSADLSNIAHVRDDGGTDEAVASLGSMDSNGFTLNYSDGSSSARKWLAFAFGDSTATVSLPTLSASTYVPGSVTATGWRPRVTATY